MDDMYAVVERQTKLYNTIDQYIEQAEILSDYNVPLKKIDKPVIWMYWNDLRLMPKIVKRCIESVKRHAGREVILLTDDTVQEYVNLPVFIWEKYKQGAITKTHFSDILRIALLAVYGGTWIDATVYFTDDIPRKYLDCDLCMVRGDTWLLYDFQKCVRCSSWYISACSENGFIMDIRNHLYGYWAKEETLKEYYLLHIIVARLLDQNTDYKKQWKNMPFISSQDAHYLHSMLPQTFDEDMWREIKAVSFIHKLTYKMQVGNFESYFKKIMRDEIR